MQFDSYQLLGTGW